MPKPVVIMGLLGSLGIDIKLLLAQIINFGLLLWLLKKFLFRPIVERIERDEAELEQARREREKLDKERVEFRKQKEEEVSRAHQRAREIVKEAEELAAEIKKKARQEAEEEKRAVVAQIRSRLIKLEDEATNDNSNR